MKKTISVIAIIAMLLCTAAACGNDAEPSSATTGTSGNTASSETAKEEKVKGYASLTALVHLREKADILSDSLSLIEPGEIVSVFKKGEEWSYVSFGDLKGYVPTEYLEDTKETPASTEASSQAEPVSTASPAVSEETTTTAAPTSQAYSDPSGGVLSNLGLFDLTGLANTSVPYGNNWEDKDAKTGLANGIFWYEAVYGKYNGVYRIKTDAKMIYITMDEGYEAGYTPRILDILKEKNVKAVFFITKQFLDSDPELVQRMIDEGHIIGNHTCNHPSGGYPKTVDEKGIQYMIDDVTKLHKLVYDQFGYNMKLFRFPEGESSELTLAAVNNLGYTPVFWSYAHKDYDLSNQPETSVTLERCLSHLATGSVYLLHAVSESNTNALADFIDQARAAGYEFGVFPVDEVSLR